MSLLEEVSLLEEADGDDFLDILLLQRASRGTRTHTVALAAAAEASGAFKEPSVYIRHDHGPRTFRDLIALFPTDTQFRTFFRFTAAQAVELMQHLGIVSSEYTVDAPCEPEFYIRRG